MQAETAPAPLAHSRLADIGETPRKPSNEERAFRLLDDARGCQVSVRGLGGVVVDGLLAMPIFRASIAFLGESVG